MPPPLDPKATAYFTDPHITLAGFERAIMHEPDEIAAAFDENGWLVLLPRRGGADEVGFYESERPLLAGAIVTHNHPTGVGLSRFDAFFASFHDVAQIRAVLPSGVIHAMAPLHHKWPDAERLLRAFDDALVVWRQKMASRALQRRPGEGKKESEDALYALRRDAAAALGVRMEKRNVWR